VDSCTLLTTVANDLIRPLHLRMPVILPPVDQERWLDPTGHEVERLQPLLQPHPAEAMTAYPGRTRVNSPAIDNANCIHPLTEPGDQPGDIARCVH
jgi:putative SOS response-associated peptidase YedK